MKNMDILKNNIKIDYRKNLNKIEEQVYEGLSDTKRKELIDLNILKITETTINEFIKTDLENRSEDYEWITKNLDSFYQIKLEHMNICEKKSKSILPKTRDSSLREKIININIIISSLYRIEGILLYNKCIKKEYPESISSNINFTKGYLVCFNKKCTDVFKNYEYIRKKIKYNPTIIKEINNDKKKVIDVINNKTYTDPIWIKNTPINNSNIENLKIYKNILKEDFEAKIIIEMINFLNKTEIRIEKDIFEKIDKIANKSKILDNSIISKNSLKNKIYQIGKESEDVVLLNDNSEIDNNNQIKGFINTAAAYELIKKQIKEINNEVFYFTYVLDTRSRIYCWNWPINYQLNHVVRNVIIINKEHEIKEIYQKFMSNDIIKEVSKDFKIFIIDKIKEKTKEKLKIWTKNYLKLELETELNIEDKIKMEIIIMLIKKITEKIETKNDLSIEIGISLVEEFIEDDIIENIEKWIKILKIKKIPLLVSLHKNFKNIKNNKFDGMYWGDASSNAIQLITLRLGNVNEELLMLTNISENETECSNIYEYITKEIKKLDHNSIIKKLCNKLSKEEINKLQNNNDNKYRVMPASYGMGRHKNMENMENLLQDRKELWEKLDDKEKRMLADYFWEKTFEILENIGFSLKEYKNICKQLGDYDLYTWYNDYGIPIVPINLKKSKRQKILSELNKLKHDLKKNENNEKEKTIKEKIEKKKEQRELDDKKFWKRSMIKIKIGDKEDKMCVRIYHSKIEIDKKETKQAVVPNSIHSYDASVIAIVIEFCKKLNIKITVIHDSIGCNIIYAPIIKTLFKIANILILKKNIKKEPFPFDNEKTKHKYKLKDQKDIEILIKKIMESSNMFR